MNCNFQGEGEGNREILVRRVTQYLVIILPNLEYVTRSKIDLYKYIYIEGCKMLGMMIPNNDLISLLINKKCPGDEVLKSG